MNQLNRYYIIRLTVDEDHEGVPDDDEVQLHIESELLNDTTEFGIVDAKVVPLSNTEFHGDVYRRLQKRN